MDVGSVDENEESCMGTDDRDTPSADSIWRVSRRSPTVAEEAEPKSFISSAVINFLFFSTSALKCERSASICLLTAMKRCDVQALTTFSSANLQRYNYFEVITYWIPRDNLQRDNSRHTTLT